MHITLILHDHPHDGERTYNGLRLASALAERHGRGIKVFMFGDVVISAALTRPPADELYDPHGVLKSIAAADGEVGCCRSCLETRQIEELAPQARRATLADLSAWIEASNQVITF
jgi:uncharacterized protein involved in oxidation of intracellular sulfur